MKNGLGLRKNSKMTRVIALVLLVLLFTGGCTSSGVASVSARESRQANSELVVAIGSEPEAGFDSTTGGHGSITRLIFSTLFRRDKALGWENDLATGYSVSEDRMTWTIALREDAVFSDGEPVTAEDVAYTYETAKAAASEIDLTIIQSVEVVDAHTVAFHLVKPYSPFIERLAYLGIVPEHAHNEGFKDQPIGSGPFEFVQWDKGQQIIFKANEKYYGAQPNIKQLTLVFLDRDVAFAAVKKGDVDVASITGAMASQEVEGAVVVDIPSIECYGVSFPMVQNEGKIAKDGAEMGNNVTSDVAIRKALNAAVDRERMVAGILNGFGTPSTTGLEGMPWLNEATVLEAEAYGNLELAKQILTDGGWNDTDGDGIVEKNGVKASFNLLYTSGVYRQELALEFENVARQVGIEVILKQTTWDTILPDIHRDAVLYGFGSGDPSELYNLYYGGNAGGIVPWDNSGCYDNAYVNGQIESALSAKDEAEALTYWKNLQKSASPKGDAPYAWLVNANHVYLVANGFSFGEPLVQPHGGRIFDNVIEWLWQ